MTHRHLPNLITNSRLLLALVFFVTLSLGTRASLNAAFVIFVVAGLTDILDGYLARHLKATSSFGRVADPFVDKILVCGAFILLLANSEVGYVRAWMVLVIVGRELLVTAVRSFAESQRKVFAANVLGKLKMFLQSLAIAYTIFALANWREAPWWPKARTVGVALVYVATLATLASGLIYLFTWRTFYRDAPDA
ncbi:MAG: CDP-diacylglycerol--glycerol-3-phosphate 3-phosphatidyltransferase [Planctomycetota bacterium]